MLVTMERSPSCAGLCEPRLAAADCVPDQVCQAGRPDDLRGGIQLCQRPPSPGRDPIGRVHRLNPADLPAGLVGARKVETLALAYQAVAVAHRQDLPVHLTEPLG